MTANTAEFIFEISFEVANKVGGIYAVLSSKASEMQRHYAEKYCVIGPYNATAAKSEFEEADTGNCPPAFAQIFKSLEKEGVFCHYGTWTVAGMPKCILIDASKLSAPTNEIKRILWEKYKIDSLHSDGWFDGPLPWAWACGMLLERLQKQLGFKNAVAHFHEWLAGVAMLYLKAAGGRYATVFTTHATMLGRAVACAEDINSEIENGLKAERHADLKKAYDYHMEAKHLTECACARACDVMTVVSESLAAEAEYILGRKPDAVLPNGLDLEHFASMETLSYMHVQNKEKIIEFLQGYFEPYYSLNLDDPRIMFTSGRYEYRNKGYDMFIDALGKLNRRLKEEKSKKDVFALIFVPADTAGENVEALKNISLFNTIEDYIRDLVPQIKKRLLHSVTSGNFEAEKNAKALLDTDAIHNLKKMSAAFRASESEGRNPPFCAMQLKYGEENDQIVRGFKACGLLNRKEDRVKAVFYPAYMSKADRLLAMDYLSILIGCSAGVFPSYYESWGYTPLETAASGTISITTDLAGYGRFIKEASGGENSGIFVVSRKNKSFEESASELAGILYRIAAMSKEEIIMQKNRAKELSFAADWKFLSKHYFDAHELALKKAGRV